MPKNRGRLICIKIPYLDSKMSFDVTKKKVLMHLLRYLLSMLIN